MTELNHSFCRLDTMVYESAAILSTMVEFKERLSTAMAYAKMDRATLASRLRVTRVAIDKVLDGRSKSMTAENCARTAMLLKVNHFWLATGTGSMQSTQDFPAQEPREAVMASDTTRPYGWPMQTIKLHEYLLLSERQQGHIEGQIRSMLDAIEETTQVKSGGGQEAA